MSPIQQMLTVGAFVIALISAVVGGVWKLSSKIDAGNAGLTSQIATLQSDLGILKAHEEARDEKINKMWEWWLKSLENGWAAHMRSVDRGQ